MKTARLEMLGLEVPLNFFSVFHDDGYVDSIKEHERKICRKYRQPFKEDKYIGRKDPFGKAIYTNGIVRLHCHIFYRDTGLEPLNIAVRAHEETHALDYLVRLDYLSQKMLKEQGVKFDFRSIDWRRDLHGYKRGEVAAHIGAIFALNSKGFSPDQIDDSDKSENFIKALQLYEKSKI